MESLGSAIVYWILESFKIRSSPTNRFPSLDGRGLTRPPRLSGSRWRAWGEGDQMEFSYCEVGFP